MVVAKKNINFIRSKYYYLLLDKRKIEISYAKLAWRITFWTSFGLFCYNAYLLKSSAAPEDQLGTNGIY